MEEREGFTVVVMVVVCAPRNKNKTHHAGNTPLTVAIPGPYRIYPRLCYLKAISTQPYRQHLTHSQKEREREREREKKKKNTGTDCLHLQIPTPFHIP